tara:strand:- start:103 stop:438 length:336 start_codon:yes stop_codon:yes gene_type:complete
VIKEGLKISRSLEYERDFLISCNRADSAYLLKMLQDSDVTSRASSEGLGPEWDDVHRRLFLEHCSLGSLEDLLFKRRLESVSKNRLKISAEKLQEGNFTEKESLAHSQLFG